MSHYYAKSFCNGQYIDLPTADDEVPIFYSSEAVTITKLLAQAVNEAIACATTPAKIDVGISGDDNCYIAAYEPADNSLEGAILDMTSSLLSTSVSAGTTLIASVNTAGAEDGTSTGQLIFIIEAKKKTTSS